MRIISGHWRGKKLQRPPQEITRPTSDRIKESLFNILLARVKTFDSIFAVDVFAGSGALGIECLSRGASLVFFAEKDPKARMILEKNIQGLKKTDHQKTQVFSHFQDLPPCSMPCRLIFLDPPYDQDFEYKALEVLNNRNYINAQTIVCLETSNNGIPSTLEQFHLTCLHQKIYGTTALSLWMKTEKDEKMIL